MRKVSCQDTPCIWRGVAWEKWHGRRSCRERGIREVFLFRRRGIVCRNAILLGYIVKWVPVLGVTNAPPPDGTHCCKIATYMLPPCHIASLQHTVARLPRRFHATPLLPVCHVFSLPQCCVAAALLRPCNAVLPARHVFALQQPVFPLPQGLLSRL